MTLPDPGPWLITDPWFYAVAVPAVLLMGISKSGFGAGFGALATPLMALTIPVPQAAAIMLPLLAVMDGLGFLALLRHADRALLRLLLPAGVAGSMLGWACFGWLAPTTVAGIVGVLTLLFVAHRLLQPAAPAPAPAGGPQDGAGGEGAPGAIPGPVGRTRAAGWVLGIASGFTSFVAHAGSPPVTAWMLPMRLAPITYTATLAVFFAVVNLSKWVPYGLLGLIDGRNLATSLVLMPLAPLGVWLGLRLARRVSPVWFWRLVLAGMTLTGLKLLADGLRGAGAG
jgi:uncharacterized membrane protein YfcA